MAKSLLSRFDFFRKVPEDLQVASTSGRLFSLFSCVLMVVLVYSHIDAYRTHRTRSFVTLDTHQEDRLRINFNVSLLAIPCAHASIDMSDHMGQTFVNITRHVRRVQLASDPRSGDVTRLSEVVIDEHAQGVPSWGGIDRTVHAGVHYSTPLTANTFDEYMRRYELVLVNYYAPWCPFSRQLQPEWEKAAAQLDDHPEFAERVRMASVDCTDPQAAWLCRRAHIRAFPSMLIYMYGSTATRFIYNGPRSAEHLLQFLDLFFRRLEPEADFADEVNVNSNNLGLVPVNHDAVESLALPKVQQTLPQGAIEGCELSGSLSVQRVPGKIVFTARAPLNDAQSVHYSAINVTHRVAHFSFGQFKRKEHLVDGQKSQLSVATERHPLDGMRFYAENDNITIEHFMNVVGFDHDDLRQSMFDVVERIYAFSASSNQYNASATLPAALFSFDISPLVINVVADTMPLYRFVTSLCAVVGGVFTVIGLLDSGVFHAMNSIQKKQQLGKYS